jgi:amino acid transporter
MSLFLGKVKRLKEEAPIFSASMAVWRVNSRSETRIELRRKLNTFDVTNLVVGSIIGADIYVATGIGAKLVAPSSLVIWILAGAIAVVIALAFAHCVMVLPKVGGHYAYVWDISSPFGGFVVGWPMLLAEWFSLAVFPVAFP